MLGHMAKFTSYTSGEPPIQRPNAPSLADEIHRKRQETSTPTRMNVYEN